MIKRDAIINELHDTGYTTSIALNQFIEDVCNSPILDKCFNNEIYCQNVYAALCNNDWVKGDLRLSMSWRYAGGLVSVLQQKGGDYLDWYCSGLSPDFSELGSGVMQEGHFTHEILEDFLNIGWNPIVNTGN